VKIASLSFEFSRRSSEFDHILVHTGQYYDQAMDRNYFEALSLPEPQINIVVRSTSHAVQTTNIMI
jgi:UDP-N-acetylglucosamine 2-epimerase (non-hydrolysing)